MVQPPAPLVDTQSLEDGVGRVRVEARLELREQLAGDRRDVGDTRHWQQDAFRASGVSHLE